MKIWHLASIFFLAGLAGCAQGPVALQAAPDAVTPKPAPPAGVLALAEKPAGAEADAPAEGFVFPTDKGGKLLEQRLTPAAKLPALPEDPAQPRHRAVPATIARPELPLPTNPIPVARLPLATSANPVRPRALADEPPLAHNKAEPSRPQRSELPTVALVRLPAVDAERPALLPTLAQPVLDREPLTDPTTDASLKAALAAVPPERTTPAPFVRESLPDPFENGQVVKVRTPPADADAPYTGPPRLPRP